MLQAKEAALPDEPSASAPDPLVTCVLRFPDGSRLARRFRTVDLLQSLFDFTDAKVQPQTASHSTGCTALAWTSCRSHCWSMSVSGARTLCVSVRRARRPT